jgi:TonB family protein
MECKFMKFFSQRAHSDRKALCLVCYFDGIMPKFWWILVLFPFIGLSNFGQSPYDAGPSKDPRAVFAAIAPYYNFMDASLKPWHLKVNYQLDDEKGNPAGQGVFEYWWVSPDNYRSTWRRGGSTHSEWHTNGKDFVQTTGEPLSIYEYWLQSALLSPLPNEKDLDPAKSILIDHRTGSTNSHSRCIMVAPAELTEPVARTLPFGTYPEYCVNKTLPFLLGYYSFGSVLVKCDNFIHVQGKSMPREVYIIDGSHEIFSAKVEPVDTISPVDPALTPPAEAIRVNVEKTKISAAVGSGLLVKKVAPAYPEDAKGAHIGGKVILQTTIGPDGSVQDVRLVSAPSPSLALSAFRSVSQSRYKPYQISGEPVTVETTVEVDFSLSG